MFYCVLLHAVTSDHELNVVIYLASMYRAATKEVKMWLEIYNSFVISLCFEQLKIEAFSCHYEN